MNCWLVVRSRAVPPRNSSIAICDNLASVYRNLDTLEELGIETDETVYALLGGKTFAAPNTGRAPLKPVSEYKLVGKRVIEAVCVGVAEKLQLPELLHVGTAGRHVVLGKGLVDLE